MTRRVSEFAHEKGVTRGRVYQLIRSGVLPAEELGDGTIVLDEAAMDWHPRRARPLSQAMAWHLLSAFDGEWPAGIRNAERARIRRHIAAIEDAPDPALELAAKVSGRAQLEEYVAPPEQLDDLRKEPRLQLSGVSAPGSRVSAIDLVEAHVSAAEILALRDKYLLAPQRQGNMRLRVSAAPRHGRASIAADLADWRLPRVAREADRIITELLQERPELPLRP